MQLIVLKETNISSAAKNVTHILRNAKIHRHVHKSPQLASMLN